MYIYLNIFFMDFFKHHHLRINFNRKELLILILSLVTSFFAFSLTQAEENETEIPVIIVK